jgi:hypothetical protein
MRRAQRGQALVLALGFLAATIAAYALVFNVGQAVNAKLRLNSAADSAAYSAAVWQARSLNYQAYLNRGMVANEVAIAQLVSLRSWSGYMNRTLGNAALVSNVIPPLGRVMHALSKAWKSIDATVQRGLPPLESGVSRWNVDVLQRVQSLAQQQAVITAADLAAEVARANVPQAKVSRITAALQASNATRFSDFSQIRRHGDRELRDYVQLLADSRDGFTADRRADAVPPNPLVRLPKRGGTDLIGEYAWRGVDTMASHTRVLLDTIELPIGWGAAESRHHAQNVQGRHGDSRPTNPRTTRLALANSAVRTGYRGVPEFRDVRGRPTEDEARLRYLVALEISRESLSLADFGLGVGENAPLRALGAAEVYFMRPDERLDGRTERPSLFSPYWQARLAARPTGGLRALAGTSR